MTRPLDELKSPMAGFTLIELLIVIAIIAVVTTLAVPSIMRPSERFALGTTVRELTAALRLTRSAAISRNTELVLLIDVDQRSYRSVAVGDRHFPPSVAVLMTVADSERLSQSLAGIRFFPDGSSTGGELALSLKKKRANLCVHWLTGQTSEAQKC